MIALESDDEKVVSLARASAVNRSLELMPKGTPDFKSMTQYPMISDLIAAEGKRSMHKVILLMVKDLCNSLNLVRNMNEGQMTETAAFLLEECGNFRLEDYLMMFAMMKRGKLVKILDRVDMQVIGQAIDEYWKMRNEAGEQVLGDRADFDFTGHPAAGAIHEMIALKVNPIQAIKKELEEEQRAERAREEEQRAERAKKVAATGLDLSSNKNGVHNPIADARDKFDNNALE